MVVLASRQGGVVGRSQLVELGYSRAAVGRAVAGGLLAPIHRGAYVVGHRHLASAGRRFAAVLACGSSAVLSHVSAAEAWGLHPGARARYDVTVPRTLRPRPGLSPHRGVLAEDERTRLDGLPVTTVARTLLDLAAVLDEHRLERALERAEILRLLDLGALSALLGRYPRRAGTPALRGILRRGALDPRMTRSDFEEAFLAFLAARDLPRPSSGVWVPMDDGEGPGVELDVAWPAARLAVELDPRSTHGTAAAFERDRRKDQRLLLVGWRVVRITPRRLREEPHRLARLLGRLLQPPTLR